MNFAPAPAAASRLPNVLRGMALMLLAAFLLSATHASIRYVSADVHAFEVAFFRCFVGLLVLVPLFARYGSEPLRTNRLGLHVLRGSLNALSMFLVFAAVAFTPLAKVAAIDFTSPLFAAALAMAVLKEKVRFHRIAAIGAGFTGTWLVFRPGLGSFDLGAGMVLLGSAIWGFVMITIKMLSRTDSNLTIMLYSGLVMTPLSFLAALPVWQTPTLEQLAWLAAVGVFGTLNQWCVAEAFRQCDMTAVLPVDFTRLVFSTMVGFSLFGEVPDVWTWIGGTIIFVATMYMAFWERSPKAAR